MNAQTFQAGDKILLHSGDTWHSQTLTFNSSGSASNPITLSSYGSGASPTISPDAIDVVGVTLNGVSNFAISKIAVQNAYEGIRLSYSNVSNRANVSISQVNIHDLTDAYNSQPGLYNHTSSAISMKAQQPSSSTRSTALTGLSIKDSSFDNVGAATWFGGLDTNSSGFQDNSKAQWFKDVTMSNLNVTNGRLWGYNVLFVDGGKFTNLAASTIGSDSNQYGSGAVIVAYSNNLQFDNLRVRGVRRNAAQNYDGVGFDFEGVGSNIALTNSVIDDTDGAGIFLFNNSGQPMTDILVSNVTLSRFSKASSNPNSAIFAQAGGGNGLISDVRVLNSTGAPATSGPISSYLVRQLTSTTVASTAVAPAPAPLETPTGLTTLSAGSLGTARNNSTSLVGLKFTTSAAGLELTGLGRAWSSDSIRPHTVQVYRDSDKALIATCKVSPVAPTQSNGAKYCNLLDVIDLTPSTSYWLVSSEIEGGDSWRDSDTTASSTAVTIDGAGAANGSTFTVYKPGNYMYGPVDMLSQTVGTIASRLRFDEAGGTTAHDSSASAADGTVNGASARVGSAASGTSLTFDGSTSGVSVASSSALQSMTALTVAVWAKPTVLPAAGGATELVSKDNFGSGDYSYRLILKSNGAVDFVVQTGSNAWYSAGTVASSSAGALSAGGSWTWLVGTYDGSTVRLYLNGALVGQGSQNISGAISASSAPLRVGTSAVPGISLYNGLLDDVQIRRDAPSASQLAAWYGGYAPLN